MDQGTSVMRLIRKSRESTVREEEREVARRDESLEYSWLLIKIHLMSGRVIKMSDGFFFVYLIAPFYGPRGNASYSFSS